MKEKELQEWIETLVAEHLFFETIEESDSANPSMYLQSNADFIPNFPIDYLMRQKCLEAASHVLKKLHLTDLVSTAKNSISLEKQERLFPDLVLCDPESGSLVLVEIKRSKGAERQTATELLAYEHEIRNHYPFLSNLDICHVVIATDFSPLLDHSIAGLVTWNEKQILCLKASGNSGKFRLNFHIPKVWTSIGQKPIPSEALETVDLYLYRKPDGEEVAPEAIFQIANTALNLIAREGDRYNSHGFIMLWEDFQGQNRGVRNFCLTIGMINPYPFTVAAVELDFIKKSSTKLIEYIHRELFNSNINTRESVLGKVCGPAKRILEEKLDPMWESFSTWETQTKPSLGPEAIRQGIYRRADPLVFEFWGVLGSFARQFITMPAVREYYDRRILETNVDWRDPAFAIELLDRLTGLQAIQYGRFTCSAMFLVGYQAGSYFAINSILEQQLIAGEDPGGLVAMRVWYGCTLTASMREIGLRYMETEQELSHPPSIERCSDYDFDFATPSSIQAWIGWMLGEFLSDHPLHQQSFIAGTEAHLKLDPNFRRRASHDSGGDGSENFVDFGQFVISSAIHQFNKEMRLGNELSSIGSILQEKLGIKRRKKLFSPKASRDLSDEFITSHMINEILPLSDLIVFPIYHKMAPFQNLKADWKLLRDQFEEFTRKGVGNPGLVLTGDGGFGIGDVGIVGQTLKFDLQTQVPVRNEAGGAFSIVVVANWSDLERGILPGGETGPG